MQLKSWELTLSCVVLTNEALWPMYACSYLPSAPITTPPSNLQAMIVVPVFGIELGLFYEAKMSRFIIPFSKPVLFYALSECLPGRRSKVSADNKIWRRVGPLKCLQQRKLPSNNLGQPAEQMCWYNLATCFNSSHRSAQATILRQ